MTEIINNIETWIGEQWEMIEEFIHGNHSNPLLWIGLLVGGLIISMWAFDALNKDAR